MTPGLTAGSGDFPSFPGSWRPEWVTGAVVVSRNRDRGRARGQGGGPWMLEKHPRLRPRSQPSPAKATMLLSVCGLPPGAGWSPAAGLGSLWPSSQEASAPTRLHLTHYRVWELPAPGPGCGPQLIGEMPFMCIQAGLPRSQPALPCKAGLPILV